MTPEGREPRWRPRWPDEASLVSWTWTATSLVFHLAVINGVVLTLWLTGGEYLLDRRLLGLHPWRSVALGLLLGAGLAATARLPPLRPMWVALVRRASPPSVAGRVLVLAMGAVAEEMFFRGVLFHLAGPIAATVLFAAAHVPSERALWAWPLTGLFTGAVLGALHHDAGGVLGPILAHLAWELSGRTVVAPLSSGRSPR
jgi:membrane protease YdiL (CAAX protease family)